MAGVHVTALDSDGPLDPARHLMRVRAMRQRQVDMVGLPLLQAAGSAVPPCPLTFGASQGLSPSPTMRSVWHGEQEQGSFLCIATSTSQWAQQPANLVELLRRAQLLEIARDLMPPTDGGSVQMDVDGTPVTFSVDRYPTGWLARGDWQGTAVTLAARDVALAGLSLHSADPTKLNLPGPFRLDLDDL